MKAKLPHIQAYLDTKQIAFIGVSRETKHFSRILMQEFVNRNYEIWPINPFAEKIEDLQCFKNLSDLNSSVEAALIMTPIHETENAILNCLNNNVKRIWIINKKGFDSVSPETKQRLELQQISVISGHCPFMFLPETTFIHKFHGWILKLAGGYPKVA